MPDDTPPTAGPVMLDSEKRALGVIASISMLRMVGLFALLPVIALYAATFEDATPLLIGMAVGAYGLSQAGLQIPLGALSDRIGRAPVIAGGLVIFALGSVIAGLADSIYGVILGRFLQGAGAIAATLVALIADSIRVEVRTRAMAIFGMGIGMSFIIAVIFGPWFAARFGVPSLFFAAVAMAIAAMLMLLALPNSIEQPKSVRRWNFSKALTPALLRLDAYVFVLHAVLTAIFVGLPFLLASELEVPETSHWKFYVSALVLSLFGAVPLIIWDERSGKGRGASLGVAVSLLIAGLVLLGFFAFSFASAVFGLAVFFAGFNFLEASLPARISAIADDDARGVSLGVFASLQFLGVFVGGLIGGRFLQGGDPSDIFLVCALLAGVWLASLGIPGQRKAA